MISKMIYMIKKAMGEDRRNNGEFIRDSIASGCQPPGIVKKSLGGG
jgi:hypothetical protein